MSSYRSGVENSAMTNFKNNYSKEKDIKYNLDIIEILNIADEYYDYKYHDDIEKVNLVSKATISLLKNDYSDSARKEYKIFINENGHLGFIKLFLLKKSPLIANVLVRCKGSLVKHKLNKGSK